MQNTYLLPLRGIATLVICFALLVGSCNATVNWGSTYTAVPNSLSSNSGAEIEYYYPTSNPSDASIWITYRVYTQTYVYVQLFSTSISTSPQVISGSQAMYRPAIRQLTPNTNSGMLVAWIDATTWTLYTTIFTPTLFKNSSGVFADGTGTYTTPIEVTMTNETLNDPFLPLYQYWMSSVSIKMFNGLIYFSGTTIVSSSRPSSRTSAPPCLAFSKDGGVSIPNTSCLKNANTFSSYGPQIAIWGISMSILYVIDSDTTHAYLASSDGTSWWGAINTVLRNGNGIFTTPGFTSGGLNYPVVSVYIEGTTQHQFGAWVDSSITQWVYTPSSIYGGGVLGSAVALYYDTNFQGYGFFSGTDNNLYYEQFNLS